MALRLTLPIVLLVDTEIDAIDHSKESLFDSSREAIDNTLLFKSTMETILVTSSCKDGNTMTRNNKGKMSSFWFMIPESESVVAGKIRTRRKKQEAG